MMDKTEHTFFGALIGALTGLVGLLLFTVILASHGWALIPIGIVGAGAGVGAYIGRTYFTHSKW